MGHPSNTTRLAELFYGHPGKYIQQLKKPYIPVLASLSPICLGEMKCGCWIVLDGNNRTGLLLSANPNARVQDYPADSVRIYSQGKWDGETMEWWNPAPRTFAGVMAEKHKRSTAKREAKSRMFHGVLERLDASSFCGAIFNIGGKPVVAKGGTRRQVEGRLRAMIRHRLKANGPVVQGDFDVKLVGDDAIHVCNRKTSNP